MPPLEGIVKYGYTVDQGAGEFRGTVWAKYAERPDWTMLYSVRTKRKQAVLDCEGWMERVDKALAIAAKQRRKPAPKP